MDNDKVSLAETREDEIVDMVVTMMNHYKMKMFLTQMSTVMIKNTVEKKM